MAQIEEIAAKRYWRATDAAVVVAAWRTSGLSATAFSKRVGCSARRLLRWAREEKPACDAAVEPSGDAAGVVRLLELRPAGREQSTPLEVIAGAVSVRVSRGFDPQTLREVLEVLLETGC